MKKLLFIYLAIGLSVAVSQNKQLLYNWEVTPQTLMLNPGTLVTNQFHAGIPLASQFHINVGSSGVSVFESLNVPFPSTNLQEIVSKSEAVKSFNI